MGGGAYYSDVSEARSSIGVERESARAFRYHETVQESAVKRIHPDLDIRNRIRECCDSPEHPLSTPIAVLMDVTSSRGDDAKKIYAQVPSLLGSLKVMGIVPSPQIAWGAVGDANADVAPIQFGQFESDRRIDAMLEKIWMEEGGGGTGEESYELMAWFLAHRTKLDCLKRGKKGFAFFTGDEAPYATLSPSFVESYIGAKTDGPVPTESVFRELQERFHTFLIYPRTTAAERKTAIDSEIRQRLDAAGGRYREVDIRATLIWNNRDDLDLHCLTPTGSHIYFGHKRSDCGGELDVDRNVHGETTKPVENIRWAKGEAPRGKYRFWVELYRHHDPASNTPFKVELDVDGEIRNFEGHVRRNALGEQIVAFEITYVPKKKTTAAEDSFAAYSDDVVLQKWAAYLPSANILRVQDAASSVEVMLGVLALQHGMSFEDFLRNMKERRVSQARRDDVAAALRAFAERGVFAQVDDVFT